MLAAGTAERDLQVRETPLQEAVHMRIDHGKNVAEERKDLAVLLKEILHFPVEAGHAAETLVLAGIVDCPTVENVTAAISGEVFGNPLLERKTVDVYVQQAVGDFRKAGAGSGKPLQHVRKVRITFERIHEKLPQVLQRIRYALKEMSALLDPASEPIGPENLEGTEKDEDPQILLEHVPVHGHEPFQRIEIRFDQLPLQVLRITGAGLPDEGCDIILQRSPAASLEIDEPGLPVVKHYVPRLEIPVHEGAGAIFEQIRLEAVEIVLEPLFVKLDGRGLQETVFEVIQIEIHHPGIKSFGRIADAEIEVLRSADLHRRQR